MMMYKQELLKELEAAIMQVQTCLTAISNNTISAQEAVSILTSVEERLRKTIILTEREQ